MFTLAQIKIDWFCGDISKCLLTCFHVFLPGRYLGRGQPVQRLRGRGDNERHGPEPGDGARRAGRQGRHLRRAAVRPAPARRPAPQRGERGRLRADARRLAVEEGRVRGLRRFDGDVLGQRVPREQSDHVAGREMYAGVRRFAPASLEVEGNWLIGLIDKCSLNKKLIDNWLIGRFFFFALKHTAYFKYS